MFNFIHLNCPTCGAQLRVNKDAERFACEHCGNNYVLKQKARDLKPDDLKNISPLTTYTHQIKQWLKVGEYEIYLHEIVQKQVDGQQIFAVNVEYRNNGVETLSCRRSQWTLFDPEGYAYDNDQVDRNPHESLPGQMLGIQRIVTPGSKVRGWVTFKIPAATTIERLQFLTGNFSAKTAEYFLK
jgi:predicted RNA-binding Zn-ribbon protein involved in translation (DUF1610 family)